MTEQKQRPGPRQAPPWEREADTESVPFGSWLRQQRELREITLREISDATKISLRYLEALEEERFDLLPATLFARGFLRQYARYVGLDPDEAVNRLLVAQRADEPEAEEERRSEVSWAPGRSASSKSGGTWKNVVLIVGVAALLLGLIFLIPWLLDRQSSGEGPEDAPPGVVPADSPEDRQQAPPEPEPETGGAPVTVTLDFREDCWVEATVDGEPRVGEVRVQGESLQLEAEEYVELRLGNAGVVDVELNGEPYDLDAAPGEVRTFILPPGYQPGRSERPRPQPQPQPQPQPVQPQPTPPEAQAPAPQPAPEPPPPRAPEPAPEPVEPPPVGA
jgi:transcriptional regulator with XRE-family HTH domain